MFKPRKIKIADAEQDFRMAIQAMLEQGVFGPSLDKTKTYFADNIHTNLSCRFETLEQLVGAYKTLYRYSEFKNSRMKRMAEDILRSTDQASQTQKIMMETINDQGVFNFIMSVYEHFIGDIKNYSLDPAMSINNVYRIYDQYLSQSVPPWMSDFVKLQGTEAEIDGLRDRINQSIDEIRDNFTKIYNELDCYYHFPEDVGGFDKESVEEALSDLKLFSWRDIEDARKIAFFAGLETNDNIARAAIKTLERVSVFLNTRKELIRIGELIKENSDKIDTSGVKNRWNRMTLAVLNLFDKNSDDNHVKNVNNIMDLLAGEHKEVLRRIVHGFGNSSFLNQHRLNIAG